MDGEEDIKAGLDLHEMAEVLLRMGVWQAVVSLAAVWPAEMLEACQILSYLIAA